MPTAALGRSHRPLPQSPADFEIAIICALPVEAEAVENSIDEFYDTVSFVKAAGDTNSYTLGRIGFHNVVLAYMPGMGKATSASVSASFRSSFSGIELGLVIGICGGVPTNPENGTPIFLGDIIISTAVVQFDFIRQYPDRAARKDTLEDNLGRPSLGIRSYLAKLKTRRNRTRIEEDIIRHLSEISGRSDCEEYAYPGAEADVLYSPNFYHKHHYPTSCDICSGLQNPHGEVCSSAFDLSCTDLRCTEADELCQKRSKREQKESDSGKSEDLLGDIKPRVHLGRVASGDVVMKSGAHRNHIAVEEKVIGFEMEGAGVWDNFPTVVIKGVCDYSDSHKSKEWQPYAAAAAASCMKAFLKDWRSEKGSAYQDRMGRRRALMQFFRTSDYQGQKNRTVRARPSTCQWVFDNAMYNRWLGDNRNYLFYLSAGPGCGKSVVARKLIDDEIEGKDCLKVYFFFGENGDEGQNRATTALCAMLHQVFVSRPDLIYLAESALEQNGEKICQLYDELWDIFVRVVEHGWKSGVLLCVLDGLDECIAADRWRLINDIGCLREKRNSIMATGTVKFFVTTRPDVVMERRMAQYRLKTCLYGGDESDAISGEIDGVIRAQMSEIAGSLQLEEDVSQALLEHLLQIPHRTYLWVTLIFDEILHALHVSKKSLISLIQKLPQTVQDVYESILQRVSHKEEVKRLFHVILAAQRPLTLNELDVILAIDASSHSYSDLDLQGEAAMGDYVRLLCGLFITVHNRRVYFLHHTARDFLVRRAQHLHTTRDDQWSQSLSIEEAHKVLATACVRHLLFDEFTQHALDVRLSTKAFKKPSPLDDDLFPWRMEDYIIGNMASLFKEYSCLGNTTLNERLTLIPLRPPAYPCTIDTIECHVPDRSSGGFRDDVFVKQEFASLDSGNYLDVGPSTNISDHPEFMVLQDTSAVEVARVVKDYKAEHNFLEYAAVYWHVHVREAGVSTEITPLLRDVLNLYDTKGKAFRTWFSVYWSTSPVTDYPHFTALTIAMAFEHDDIIPLLLSNGANLEEEEPIKRRALHFAAAVGKSRTVLLLIENGAKVSSQDWVGRTPLHLAAFFDVEGPSKMDILLRHGAHIEAPDMFGLTPLHLTLNHITTAKWLIENGADMERKDQAGRTPLTIAAAGDYVDVVSLLLNKGARLDGGDMYRGFFNGSWRVTRLFDEWKSRERGRLQAERELKNSRVGPLFKACMEGDLDAISECLRTGMSTESCDSEGNTALHVAAKCHRISVIEMLLVKGANLNAKNDLQETPLHHAAQCGDPGTILYLLEEGPERFRRTRLYNLLVYLIIRFLSGLGYFIHIPSTMSECLKFLQGNIVDIDAKTCIGRTPLFQTIQEGHLETARLLLKKGADVNLAEIEGASALFPAVHLRRFDLVQLLVQHGADVNFKETSHGFTPLAVAVLLQDQRIAEYLLENGAQPNSRYMAVTPVFDAVEKNNIEMFNMLISHGADAKLIDSNGRTLLHWAVHSTCDAKLFSSLLQKGINVHVKDKLEKTALDYAIEDDFQFAIEILEQAVREQPEALSPRDIAERSLIEAVDHIHVWMLNAFTDPSLKRTSFVIPKLERHIFSTLEQPLNRMRVREFFPTVEQLPDAMLALERAAAVIQGQQWSLEDRSIIWPSWETLNFSCESPIFDRDEVWKAAVMLARLMPEKGNMPSVAVERFSKRSIETLARKLHLLLLNYSQKELKSDPENGSTHSPLMCLLMDSWQEQAARRQAKALEWMASRNEFQSESEPALEEDLSWPIWDGNGDKGPSTRMIRGIEVVRLPTGFMVVV